MYIAKLTEYQYVALCQTAQAMAPIFLMALPSRKDSLAVRFSLKRKHTEVKQLVKFGFMEDVSDEFADTVGEHAKNTGRKFAVYGLTEVGYLLFKDCEDRPVN